MDFRYPVPDSVSSHKILIHCAKHNTCNKFYNYIHPQDNLIKYFPVKKKIMNDQSDQITELKMTAKKPKNRKTAKSIKPKNRNFLLIGLSENIFGTINKYITIRSMTLFYIYSQNRITQISYAKYRAHHY